MHKLTFIVGGARSGKSSHAERLANADKGRVLFIATAEPLDDEMRTRIAAHKQNRSSEWKTVELPTGVGKYLLAHSPQADIVLLDCLTLLVSNGIMQAAGDLDQPNESAARRAVEEELELLVQAIDGTAARWVVVSNEVGQGLVPPYPIGRVFRDLLGWANQRLAAKADEVIWMVAGIPVPIGDYRQRE